MADASDKAEGGKKGGGLMGLLIPVVVLTVVAAAGGGLLGNQILASIKATATPETKAASAPAAPPDSGKALKEMTPIVTNLAEPNAASWIRLQAAIVYDKADAPQIDVLSSKIGDDILSVMRTMTVADLEGASGLEILREDLNERAAIRSDGHIKELVIEMLIVQ